MPAAKKKSGSRKSKQAAAEPASGNFALKFFLSPFLLVFWITSRFPAWLRWPARVVGCCGILSAISLLILSIIYFSLASKYNLTDVQEMPARSYILDRHDHELGFIHGENRHLVTYDDVPEHFINALIAREDARFRKHSGIDLRAIGRSIHRLVTRGKLEGGGTLSMQLARNSFELKKGHHTKLQSIHRKFLEMALAVRIENRYDKNEIIQHYMNRIFWGGSVLGVENASRHYFGKQAKDLDLSESALLVGIVRAPNAFSPFKSLDAAKFERDTVLNRMAHYGFISENLRDETKELPIEVRDVSRRLVKNNYAIDAIRRDLERILEDNNIKRGGLVIKTTIDNNLQKVAEKSVEKRLADVERISGYRHQTRAKWQRTKNADPAYLQGAAVVIENQTGAVLAIVGGRDASESQYNRAIQGGRPVGSIFKPFVFLSAFDHGLSPNETVSDARIQPGEIAGAPNDWSPTNSDGKYYRHVRVSQALIDSRNTSSIRVGTIAGVANVTEVARLVGFSHENIDPVPSSYLGPWNATPYEVASAYSVFPNGGVRYRPYLVTSIEDRHGKVLWKNGPMEYSAANQKSTAAVSNILEQVNKRGTASSVRHTYGFNAPSAGKTGTTDNYTDAWYAGYTSSLSCAVWVGMDQPERIISRGYGSRLALPIWVDIMKTAQRLGTYKFKNISPTGNSEIQQIDPVRQATPVEDGGIRQAIPVP